MLTRPFAESVLPFVGSRLFEWYGPLLGFDDLLNTPAGMVRKRQEDQRRVRPKT
jgi:hypothetical protein